jgi:hypothetical protein
VNVSIEFVVKSRRCTRPSRPCSSSASPGLVMEKAIKPSAGMGNFGEAGRFAGLARSERARRARHVPYSSRQASDERCRWLRQAPARLACPAHGRACDLEDLVELITSPDLRVVEEGADFFLESVTFDRIDGSVDVLEEAQRLLPRLNGAGKLKRHGFRDVDVDGHLIEFPTGGGDRKELLLGGSTEPRGSVTHGVIQPATLELRLRIPTPTIVVDGQSQIPDPGTLETDLWLKLAERDPDVARALSTFGSRPHDWVNLYRIFEIIEGRADIVGSEWASRNETERFSRTANHPDAAGPDARHARSSVQPPPQPMMPEEGVELIRRILLGWLGSLASS